MTCNVTDIKTRLIDEEQTRSRFLSCLQAGHRDEKHSAKELDTHWTPTPIAPATMAPRIKIDSQFSYV